MFLEQKPRLLKKEEQDERERHSLSRRRKSKFAESGETMTSREAETPRGLVTNSKQKTPNPKEGLDIRKRKFERS